MYVCMYIEQKVSIRMYVMNIEKEISQKRVVFHADSELFAPRDCALP